MPELPEVETMRRGIAGAVGSRITDFRKMRCRRKPILIQPGLAPFRRRVQDRTITELGRAGKRVVIWLDSGDCLVIEPRMTGLVLLVEPPTRAHLRWRLCLDGGNSADILYWDQRGLGNVRLFSKAEFHQQFGLHKLGPDALVITAEHLRERLGRSEREIKPALLDQRAVAGIGNIYASEILHLAGIHPQRKCRQLTAAQWQAITEATHLVLREAIRYEGSTLSNGTYRNALNKFGSYQTMHRVYNRADQACPRCPEARIIRLVQAQRSTYFCKQCQKRTTALLVT